MSARSAPRAATWLLERLGAGRRFEPLIGDLLEQFEAGRSRLWYWHQTMGALASHAFETLRRHAPTFLAALAAGCVLNWLWQLGCSLAFQPLYVDLAQIKHHPWSPEALLRLAGLQANMACEYALSFFSAWLVTRVHRAHQRAVLLVFVAVLIAGNIPAVARLILDGTAESSVAIPVATQIILTALRAACTLVAGLWAIRTLRLRDMNAHARRVAVLWIAQLILTGLLYDACRVGEITYRRSEAYLAMFAAAAACGLYVALLLWRQSSTPPTLNHPAELGRMRGRP